jgi:glycosyltransferase involved in cell wall biosynthesis
MSTEQKHSVITNKINGLVVPASDEHALMEAIDQLITDTSLGMQLGEQAREQVKARFSLYNMVNAYTALFSEVSKGTI